MKDIVTSETEHNAHKKCLSKGYVNF